MRVRDADQQGDDLITWSPGLSVDFDSIDREHKGLIVVINDLYRSVRNASGKEIIEQTFRKMREYTQTHFANEERMMAQSAYPDAEKHRAMHRGFVERLDEVYEQFRSGTDSAGISLMGLLAAWWTAHINTADTALGAHLKNVRPQLGDAAE